MTPPPDPVAALAEALHRVWSRSGSEGATIEDEAEYLHERLTAAGWSLSHDSEREALPSVDELATILWTRVRLEGVLRVRDKSEARDLALVIRAVIEGRP